MPIFLLILSVSFSPSFSYIYFFPLCFLRSLAREKLRGDSISANPRGLLSRNESRSIKLGDILIEAASFSAVAVSPRTDWRKNVMSRLAYPVLIRGLRSPFLPRDNVIAQSGKIRGGRLISGLSPGYCYPRNRIVSALTIEYFENNYGNAIIRIIIIIP